MNETIQRKAGQTDVLVAEFERLADLTDGWLNGAGKAPPRRELDWLRTQFAAPFPAGMALPFVCPTPAGGVFLEWTQGDWIISAEFPLPERRCLLQATNTKTSETVDEDGPLNDAGDFAAVYGFVRRFA
jgi:hypothetical protein